MAHQSHSMNRNLAACAHCHPLRGLEGMEEMRYDEWAVKKAIIGEPKSLMFAPC